MKAGSSKCWKPMILLKEDICMVRQTCSSKLCIYTCDIHSVVKRLETLNICPSKINKTINIIWHILKIQMDLMCIL